MLIILLADDEVIRFSENRTYSVNPDGSGTLTLANKED